MLDCIGLLLSMKSGAPNTYCLSFINILYRSICDILVKFYADYHELNIFFDLLAWKSWKPLN